MSRRIWTVNGVRVVIDCCEPDTPDMRAYMRRRIAKALAAGSHAQFWGSIGETFAWHTEESERRSKALTDA